MHFTKLYRFDCGKCEIHFRIRSGTYPDKMPTCPKHKDAKEVEPCKGHTNKIREECRFPARRIAGARLVPT